MDLDPVGEGTVPVLGDAFDADGGAGGCRFRTRCPRYPAGVCDRAQPEPLEWERGHFVSCFLYDESGKGPADHAVMSRADGST